MGSLLTFAITFCAEHVSVLVDLISEVAKLIEAHTQDVVKNPMATAVLNQGIDLAAAKAIHAVATKAATVAAPSDGSSYKNPASHV